MSAFLPPMGSVWSLFTDLRDKPQPVSSFWRLFGAAPVRPTDWHVRDRDGTRLAWSWRSTAAAPLPGELLVCAFSGRQNDDTVRESLRATVPGLQAGTLGPDASVRIDPGGPPLVIPPQLGLRPADDRVYFLNPADHHAPLWDLGRFARSPAMARQFSRMLVPGHTEAGALLLDQYAGQLIAATVLMLNRTRGAQWTFADLLAALDSPDRWSALVVTEPGLRRLSPGPGRFTVEQLKLHLEGKLAPFRQVAQLHGPAWLAVWLIAGVLRPPTGRRHEPNPFGASAPHWWLTRRN
jgi:hypothetical protein